MGTIRAGYRFFTVSWAVSEVSDIHNTSLSVKRNRDGVTAPRLPGLTGECRSWALKWWALK